MFAGNCNCRYLIRWLPVPKVKPCLETPWKLLVSIKRLEQFLTVISSFGSNGCLQVIIARLLTWSFLIGHQAPVTSGSAEAIAGITLALTASRGAVGPRCHHVLREMTLCELIMWQPNHKAHYFSAGSRQMCALRNTRRGVYLITADLLSATPYWRRCCVSSPQRWWEAPWHSAIPPPPPCIFMIRCLSSIYWV